MRITRLSVDHAFASLRSARAGLTSAEAARRLAEYGPNRVEEIAREPLWLKGARQFTHFFALILLLAAGLAFVAEEYGPGQGMATLGWAIIGVVIVNGAFAFWQEYRAERAVAALKALLPHAVSAIRDGIAVQLETGMLVPGDVIMLQEGDDVPADCRLIEGHSMRVNIATVTGESLPKARIDDAVEEDDLLKSRNVLLAGTSVVSGAGTALVFATGMHTEFGKIAHLTQASAAPPSPLQQEIARLSRLIALLATVLGVVFFLIGQMLGLGFWTNFLFAIGIIVANVPEGLLPTVTLALAMATQRMAKRNALIRHLPAAEALGAATVIVTDKTGTLTENRMQAVSARFADATRDLASLAPAEAAGHAPFFEIARRCHSLRQVEHNGAPVLLGDPMEIALVEMAERVLGKCAPAPPSDELPFDADRKRMSTVHEGAAGRMLYCKGAVEQVLPLCTQALASQGGGVAMSEALMQAFLEAQEEMAERGLRVLALACRELDADTPRENWETSLTLAGLVGLHDPPRPEVPQAIAACRAAGIRVIMVTGDHPHTARAVARDIGLATAPAVIIGETLRRLTDAQLQFALDAEEILFARVTADQKMRIVDALKRKGHVVAVTGDGVNDAPALRRADIGIAMGVVGTDVARGAADIVLLDDNFASIVAAIEEGRAVFQNIRKFLTYILTSNIPEIVPYLAFVLLRIPLPLTIIQILAVDLGTDLLPALALGAEKPAPDIMQQPPRRRAERLMNWPLVVRAYLWLGMLEAAAAMAAFFFVLGAGGWRYGEILAPADPLYLQATTACLAAIIVMQVVNVFLCRDPRESVFSVSLKRNYLIILSIIIELALILAIVYSAPGNAVFGTAPIAPEVWLFMLPFAVAMLMLEEGRKWCVRRSQKNAH
ncbi:MAG: cation-transporting P-type ATPase [Burkholderiales bacterium]|nr:cation-transporting P-type ATPase [Burkholderiales bacterium]